MDRGLNPPDTAAPALGKLGRADRGGRRRRPGVRLVRSPFSRLETADITLLLAWLHYPQSYLAYVAAGAITSGMALRCRLAHGRALHGSKCSAAR